MASVRGRRLIRSRSTQQELMLSSLGPDHRPVEMGGCGSLHLRRRLRLCSSGGVLVHALGLYWCIVALVQLLNSHIQAPSSWDCLFSTWICALIGHLRFESVAQADFHWIDVSTSEFSNAVRGSQTCVSLWLAFGATILCQCQAREHFNMTLETI